MQKKAQAIIVMGVSGSGKSTIGAGVAKQKEWLFFDADAFHPPENIAKMAAGQPLNDADRWPWLRMLQQLIHDHLEQGKSMVLACSALKQVYRDLLLENNAEVRIVYLEGAFELIWARMRLRENHYMRADMLQSQFDALEPPEDVLIVSIDKSVGAIVDTICEALLLD